MGKCQSKSLGLYRKRDGPEGECFVVNAHFNPLALSECEDILKAHHRTSSEITLSLSSCPKEDAVFANRVGFAEDRYPLQVLLPPENCSNSSSTTDELKKTEIRDSNLDEDKNCDSEKGFECDVAIEAEGTGKDRREFVFTLYDLDGYGKITKDDIAGLVRGIYEAMGTSIELPPSGSKTIKVKLTVSPEKDETSPSVDRVDGAKDCQSEKEAKRAADEEREKDDDDDDDEKDPAIAIETENAETEDETVTAPLPPPCNCTSAPTSPMRPSPPHRSESAAVIVTPSPLRLSQRERTVANGSSSMRPSCPEPVSVSSPQRVVTMADTAPISKPGVAATSSPGRWKNHHRSSTAGLTSATGLVRKQKLLEIIQANLEKNNFHYVESSRRRAGEKTEPTAGACDKHPRHHHQRNQQHVGCKNRRSHYLDLAGMENYTPYHQLDSGAPYAAEDEGEDEDEDDEEHQHHSHLHPACAYRGSGGPYRPVCAKGTPPVNTPRRSCHHHACHRQRHHCSARVPNASDPFRYHLLAEDSGAASSSNQQCPTTAEEPGKMDPRRTADKADWLRAGHPHLNDLRSSAYHVRSRSYDAYECGGDPVPPVVSFLTPQKSARYRNSPHKIAPAAEVTSPHQHHKHRHRDRDHQRAMKQVASWLEREHLGYPGPLPMAGEPVPFPPNPYHPHSPHHHLPQPLPQQSPVVQQQTQHEQPSTNSASPRTPERNPLVVERHEHHHIHEHYHHHYHHYHEL